MEKAPGLDKVTNEILKRTLDDLVPILTTIFKDIMKTGIIPTQWKTSHMVLLYKKGQEEDTENYRLKNLMSDIYGFSKVIMERINKKLDEK